MNLAQMRSRVRRDLKDEDPASYRWSDAELDRHIDRALRELSLATLSDRVVVEAVEYPRGRYPPVYVPFSLWGDTLTLLVDGAPSGGEEVVAYYGKEHTLDATTSTIPAHLEEVVAMGGEAYACLEWASFAINRVTTGGRETWRDYLTFGEKQLAAFMAALARYRRPGG